MNNFIINIKVTMVLFNKQVKIELSRSLNLNKLLESDHFYAKNLNMVIIILIYKQKVYGSNPNVAFF